MPEPAAQRFAGRAWLTPAEAAQVIGQSPSTVRRLILEGGLRTLWLTPTLRRVAAEGLVEPSGPMVPEDVEELQTAELAELWQVHLVTVQRLARDGQLSARRRGRLWFVSRDELTSFTTDRVTPKPRRPE